MLRSMIQCERGKGSGVNVRSTEKQHLYNMYRSLGIADRKFQKEQRLVAVKRFEDSKSILCMVMSIYFAAFV